jgi:hypothetical protein
MFRKLFVSHPQSVNETYLEHMGMASSFGWAMLKASGACFVHAVVPGLCEKTGSGIIRDLHGRMVTNRVVTSRVGSAPATSETDEAMLWIAANI